MHSAMLHALLRETVYLEVAEIENSKCGKFSKLCFAKVVFPLPDGAENMMTFFILC